MISSADWQKIMDEMARTGQWLYPEDPGHRGSATATTPSTPAPSPSRLTAFLPALKVTSPASLQAINPPDGVALQWDPVPGALGFIVHAMSMSHTQDVTTIIRWVSTINKPPDRVQSDYQQATSIADGPGERRAAGAGYDPVAWCPRASSRPPRTCSWST